MAIIERNEAKANQRNAGPDTRRRVEGGTDPAYGFLRLVEWAP
jgi:hypothetical protein